MENNNSKSSVVYQGKIPGRVKYSFAFGALGKDLIYGMIATFSMIYFTDIIKVAPAFIGTMFFVAKIWDAFNDLFMGMIVDNTRSRFGKFVPWLVIGTLINAFVFVIVFTDFHLSGVSFVCPTNIPLTAIAGVIVKTGTGLELGCATVFLADVVDYGEYVLGNRNEGVVFSLQTLIVKLTAAFTSLAIGFVLELTGYVPNAVQSFATQNSIRILMCVVPTVGVILAYIVFKSKYKLSDEFMKKVVAKINGSVVEE